MAVECVEVYGKPGTHHHRTASKTSPTLTVSNNAAASQRIPIGRNKDVFMTSSRDQDMLHGPSQRTRQGIGIANAHQQLWQ